MKKEHSTRYVTDEQGSINQNYQAAKLYNFAIQSLKGLFEVALSYVKIFFRRAGEKDQDLG